ncbi:substrate-binding periplasmic protein [Massilia glaciei]|nr:transporter substrate-binding domain-containing protein [Massilia glaciei]
MHITRALGLCFPLLLCLPAGADSGPRPMRLATLEWLPYVGKIVPKDGLSTVIASAAARNAGYSLSVDYFEWTVTLAKGEKDPAFAGYFPEYYTEERAKACHLSKSIGTSMLGLATMKDTPVQWNALSDLNAVKIGVVEGYSNGEAFDAMVKQGKQPVENAASDTFNLRRLISKKVPAIAIDREVLRYLLLRSPMRNETVFSPKPLGELTLHVCFKRTPAGKEMQEAFDAGLQKIDIKKIGGDYMKQLDLSGT